jgi:hypothetical protein
MNTKNDDLIKKLVSELTPKVVVKFNFLDVVKVLLVSCFCLFAAVAMHGLRSDLSSISKNIEFLLNITMTLTLGILCTVSAFLLSIPSIKNKKVILVPFIVFGIIVIATGYSFFKSSAPFLYLGHGFSCANQIIVVSVFPSAILFYLVRRAAVLKRDILGILVLMSAASFGLLGVQLTCVDSTPLHIFLWHMAPVIFLGLLGAWLAKLLIKKI